MPKIDLPTLAATEAFAARVASKARPGDAILLEGPLGAGKTAFARAFLRHATHNPALDVPSPSYTLVQTYETPAGPIHHFDLWRLDGPRAVIELGWDELTQDIVLVEWPERLGDLPIQTRYHHRLGRPTMTPDSAMILAAGLGIRMRPLTNETAKPLLPLGGRALVDLALDRLAAAGVIRTVVNVHWQADRVTEHLSHHTSFPKVIIRKEDALLETGGAVRTALPELGPAPFFVINGDTVWLDGPTPALDRLAAFWSEDVDAVLLVARTFQVHAEVGRGDFAIDPWGIARRPKEREIVPYVFAGIQILRPSLFETAPEGPFSLNLLWDEAIATGRLRAVVHDGLWFHLSTPADLAEAEYALHARAAVARRWLSQDIPAGEGLILLPTRRAARGLVDAFLRVSHGAPMLLPRITAIGALDETPLALAGALELAPAVAPATRLAELARLILALPEEAGGVARADQAWRLAGELARLMDEAERAEIPDLPTALAQVADGALAQHWDITLRFLDIVTRVWPVWLEQQGLMNPQARVVKLLHAQARHWQDHPPETPVWVAGATGGIKAVAALLKAVAALPNGMVILPGLAADPPTEIEESHPQSGLLNLLAGMGATPEDVARWEAPQAVPAARLHLLDRALLPAFRLCAWREAARIDIEGLTRLEPADQQEEAVAIALILRNALEHPGARAALVTPDRALATRVAAELLRWGVIADDSAGEPLAHSPPAVFLRLLAEAIVQDLAPVALLALLKHPLAGAGMHPAACRSAARALERQSLRGPKPQPGITGLRFAIAGDEKLDAFVAAIETCLAPMLRLATAAGPVPPAEALAALIASAEALAATDTDPGPARLWAQEEGEALAETLTAALTAIERLPAQPPTILPGLLDALLEGIAVRSRRSLRGRDIAAEHPRVLIWGLLEARLQAVDVIVLGGLAETVWPPATDPGPWMSRPMRKAAGLPSPEEEVGQTAHDFVSAACAAPIAVLSCPRRRDGAPAVPARWLARLSAFLDGQNTALPQHPAAHWARLLDQPHGDPVPVRPPTPRPAVHLRPRRLSVTEIETWSADPYAIYARHILRLPKLKPLEEGTDAADYGSIVHAGFHHFLQRYGPGWTVHSAMQLREAMFLALDERRLRPALREWWAPRLARIAAWASEVEIARRQTHHPVAIGAEVSGRWELSVPGGFTLTGRADRVERREDGSLALIDYKTGKPPSEAAVVSGAAPQLPLEAAMIAAGAFAGWHGTRRL
eukprot:gene5750-5813_t